MIINSFLIAILSGFLLGMPLETAAFSASQTTWEQVVTKARQEGRVVLGSTVGIPAFRQGITNAFAKRFAFDVELRVLEGSDWEDSSRLQGAAGFEDEYLAGAGEAEV